MARKNGLVLETHQDWAIVLFPGGHYRKVKNPGELIPGEVYRETTITVRHLAAAALLVLFFAAVVVDFFTVQVYASVGDVELGLNRWQRVVTVNNQAAGLSAATDLRGKTVEDALVVVLEEKVAAEQAPSRVTIDVKGKDNSPASQAILGKIACMLQEELQKSNQLKDLRVQDNSAKGLVITNSHPRGEMQAKVSDPNGNQGNIKPGKKNSAPGLGKPRGSMGQGKGNDGKSVPPGQNKASQEMFPGIRPLSEEPISMPAGEECLSKPAEDKKPNLPSAASDNRSSQSQSAGKDKAGEKGEAQKPTDKDEGKANKTDNKDNKTSGQGVAKDQGQPGQNEHSEKGRNASSANGQAKPGNR